MGTIWIHSIQMLEVLKCTVSLNDMANPPCHTIHTTSLAWLPRRPPLLPHGRTHLWTLSLWFHFRVPFHLLRLACGTWSVDAACTGIHPQPLCTWQPSRFSSPGKQHQLKFKETHNHTSTHTDSSSTPHTYTNTYVHIIYVYMYVSTYNTTERYVKDTFRACTHAIHRLGS